MKRTRRLANRILAWGGCVALVVSVAGCGGAKLPAPIAAATIPAYPGNGDPALLVDAEWLAGQLASDPASVVVLDASDLATYRAGHIPGSVHAWWQDTMDPNGAVYGTVLKPDPNQPDPQQLRRNFLEDVGVDGSRQVVVYDDGSGARAARIVWTLRFLGYPRSALLDGGLAAWRGAGGAVENKGHAASNVDHPAVTPQTPQESWYMVEDQLTARLGDPAYVVVDIRSDKERSDDVDRTIPLGTIPNAVRLDWTTLVDAEGRLLPPDALAAAARAAGVTPDKQIVLLGLFGTDTGLPWLALILAGFPSVSVYDGGWNEWARDPTTPKSALPS
jgi:thiosulfate/3-mercaptopyruvate sulfurtransferase